MARAKRALPYAEGTWFAVPLLTEGYALGLAARIDGKGRVFGYFFGPFDELPSAREAQGLVAKDAVYQARFGDLYLIEDRWPILFKAESWDRKMWPLPPFIRVDHFEEKAWRVIYSEDTLTQVSQERCDLSLAEHYPEDGFGGAGAVEIVLTKRLTAGR